MNKQENFQETENAGRQAVQVLKALSHFEYPTEISQVENWLEKTKPLQFHIRNLCEEDESGQTTLDCIHALYDLIATNGESVSPAVWDILHLVDEKQVESITEIFLKDSTSRLKNALCALVNGVCQCGHRIPQLQAWCHGIIKGLEDKQKYSALLSLSQMVTFKILHSLILPHSRQSIYLLFERIMYPMSYPHVFTMIIDQIPEIIGILEKDENKEMKEICDNFCGLIKVLMERFPSAPGMEESYRKLKAALSEHPDGTFKPHSNYAIWNQKPKNTAKITYILECPVCYERFATPITICENGHCICSNCKCQLKNCPLCRAQFSTIRMMILDQIMEVTEFHCKNFSSGCNAKMLYKDIWDHEVDCEYRTISCDVATFHNPLLLVCKEDVVVAHFHEHFEKCHQAFVVPYELNTERRVELRRQRLNEVRLLKTSAKALNFVERIYVTEDEIFFSYHYIGRNADAKNYIYTITIKGKGLPQKIKYTNFCLPNYMGICDTEVNEQCLILEPEKIFDSEQSKFEYSVKIQDLNACRLKLKKNKFVVSN